MLGYFNTEISVVTVYGCEILIKICCAYLSENLVTGIIPTYNLHT